MSELEMEIGRTLGASCFFVYQTVKHNPNASVRDIQIETGLSENCVEQSLKKLRESQVVERERQVVGEQIRQYLYRENGRRETWKFH